MMSVASMCPIQREWPSWSASTVANACEFDADHEGDGLFDGELDAGHVVEQLGDFPIIVEWV